VDPEHPVTRTGFAFVNADDKFILSSRHVESPIGKGPVLLRWTGMESAAEAPRQPFSDLTIDIRHSFRLNAEGGTGHSL
jgi:hypothetical protein